MKSISGNLVVSEFNRWITFNSKYLMIFVCGDILNPQVYQLELEIKRQFTDAFCKSV